MYLERFFACAIASFVLVPSESQAEEMTAHEAALYEAAKVEGSVTWYVSQVTTENADKSCAGFRAKYPGITCNPVRASGQVVFQRIQQELAAGALQADVMSTNDIGQLYQLKQEGALLQYAPEGLAHMLPLMRDAGDADGYWFTSAIAPIVMVYNTDQVSKEEAPKNWTDLYDPKWKGQVAIGHPGFSGSVGLWTVLMDDLYGWDFFTKLELNEPHIGRSIADGANLVISGERKIAIAPLATVLNDQAKGAPIAEVLPTDGALMPPSGTGIMKGAQHPNAAKLFAEFFLSKENSQLFVDRHNYPLRADVPISDKTIPLDDYKLINVPIEKGIKKVPELQAKFRDTFGI
ncbi:MAG TPA: extracellular solute-binding protein [Rhizobiaceae bacterium]|nr:extracellular solute-binding protein [Rhizobiaceae bacterium]